MEDKVSLEEIEKAIECHKQELKIKEILKKNIKVEKQYDDDFSLTAHYFND